MAHNHLRYAARSSQILLAAVLLSVAGCSGEAPTDTQNEPSTKVAPAGEGDEGAARSAANDRSEDTPAKTGTAQLEADAEIDSAQLGIAVYPGSRRIQSGRWRMSDAQSEGADTLTFMELYTADELDKVAEFYRGEAGSALGESFEFDDRRGRTMSLTLSDKLSAINIILQARRGEAGTHIEINRLGAGQTRAMTREGSR